MRYEFTFAKPLSPIARAAFPELQLSVIDSGGRTLYGSVTDRAHLDGLLERAAVMGLELTDLHRLPD